jgi:antitoxin component YwqK of YwqJK toxin-antitoxin module
MKFTTVIIILISLISCSVPTSDNSQNTEDMTLNCDSAVVNNKLMLLASFNSTFYDDKYTGVVESHFENNPNQLEWVLHYENGEIVKHVNYYPNGNKKIVEPVKCNSTHGKYLFYNEKGILISRKNYFLGKQEGLAKGYYPNGKLQRTINFKNNLKHGNQYEFNQNGDSTEMGVFVKGEMVEKRTITPK